MKPKPWPENAWPAGEQYRDWLLSLTPAEQTQELTQVIANAEHGANVLLDAARDLETGELIKRDAMVRELRTMATAEFAKNGVRSARGAAIWDIAGWLAEERSPTQPDNETSEHRAAPTPPAQDVEALAPTAQDMQSAGPEPKHRVHNHPPYRPVCRELFDEQGRLVGDCVREEEDPHGEALVRLFRDHSIDWFDDGEGRRQYYCICDEDQKYYESVEGHAYHLTQMLRAAGYLPPAEVARLVQEARKVALWEAGVQVGSKRSNPGESEDYRRGFREAIDWAMSGVQGLPREMSIADSAASAVRPVPGERSEAGA